MRTAKLAPAALACLVMMSDCKKEVPASLPGGGTASVDGLSIVITRASGSSHRLRYVILADDSDVEINHWLLSQVPIAYCPWNKTFFMKEVQSQFISVAEQGLYEFHPLDCI